MSTTRALLHTPVNPLLGAQIDALGLQRETQELVTACGFFTVAELVMFADSKEDRHGRTVFKTAWPEIAERLKVKGLVPGALPWHHMRLRSVYFEIADEATLHHIIEGFAHLGHCDLYLGPSLLAVALHPDLGLGEKDIRYINGKLAPLGLFCGATLDQWGCPVLAPKPIALLDDVA